MPADLNNTFIALIPKSDTPETIRQYRPISLCNTLYKVVTKILANRLRITLPHRISPTQNSFLPGRGSETNVIIASKVVHSIHHKKGPIGFFALKLDLEKAYDKLEWGFIRNCLFAYGLDEESVKLVMSCISSVF